MGSIQTDSATSPLVNQTAHQSVEYVQAEEFRKRIETETLRVMQRLAESGVAPPEQIQEMAQYVLLVIQEDMSVDQLYQAVFKLDDKYPEFGQVVITIMQEYEEKYEKKALDLVSQLVKNKKFDEAQDVVQKVLEFKVT